MILQRHRKLRTSTHCPKHVKHDGMARQESWTRKPGLHSTAVWSGLLRGKRIGRATCLPHLMNQTLKSRHVCCFNIFHQTSLLLSQQHYEGWHVLEVALASDNLVHI